ncbi:MAG: YbaK/EbsC family protein [Oscillospiraceae bacterium]
MSIKLVRDYFSRMGIAERIMEFPVSSATVELAAQALHCEPARIAKTLSFYGEEGCFLIVTAGDAKVDNPKFKQKFGFKAKMCSPEDVLAMTGHAVGGVCPFGIPENLPVYTDVSLKRFETVFPACGSSNSAIELTCDELYRLAASREWIDVCKGWRPADE